MRVAIVVLVAALATVPAAAGGSPAPRVLVHVGTLAGFAQDGDRIVWADTGVKTCKDGVRTRDLRTGRTTGLATADICLAGGQPGGFLNRMALAGDRALFALVGMSHQEHWFDLWTAGGTKAARHVALLEAYGGTEDNASGKPFPVLAGDGSTLAFTDVSTYGVEPGGDHVRLGDGSRIPETFGTQSLAVAGGTLGLARVDDGGCVCNGPPVTVSADGTRVLYRSRRGPGGRDRIGNPLFVTRLDGVGGDRYVTSVTYLHWAADSRHLVGADGDWLVRVDAATGATTRVVKQYGSWSPSGDRVGWTENGQVWVADSKGRDVRKIGAGEVVGWSADGDWIAIAGADGQISIARLQGGKPRLVAKHASNFTWAPAGPRFLFSTVAGLWAGSPAGGTRSVGPRVLEADWSPDGKRIVYEAESGDGWRYLVVNADGSQPTEIARGSRTARLLWSPDSRALAVGTDSSEWVVVIPGKPAVVVGEGWDAVWSGDSRRVLLDASDGSRWWTRVYDVRTGASKRYPGVRPVAPLPSGGALLRSGSAPDDVWSDTGEIVVATSDLAGQKQLTHTRAAPPWHGIELRVARTGAIERRFATRKPVDVAIDARHVAVVVADGTGRSLELRARTGRLIRSFPFVTTTEPISFSGRWVVYETKGRITALDVTSGRVRAVAAPKGRVMGLSIEGTRVAWGEDRGGGGKDVILAVDLPR